MSTLNTIWSLFGWLSSRLASFYKEHLTYKSIFLYFQTVVTEETYSLIIRKAQPSHAGQYRLVALNEAGRHSYTYEVNVEQPLVPV